MIKNLNQLKNALRPGIRFKIIAHCRENCIGQLREVTLANTQGFYSISIHSQEDKANICNRGRGPVLWWSKAPFWEFKENTYSIYSSDTEHTEKTLIMSFQIQNMEVIA